MGAGGGEVAVNRGLTVSGATTVETLQAKGAASLNNGLTVNNAVATLNKGLTVNQAVAEINNGLIVQNGDLMVRNATTAVEALTAKGAATFDKGISVNNAIATLNKGLAVSGGATSVQMLRATGLFVTGNTSVQALTATGLAVNQGDTSVQTLTATRLVVTNGETKVQKLTADDTSVQQLTATGITVNTGETKVQKLTATGLSVSGGNTAVQVLTSTSLTVDGRATLQSGLSVTSGNTSVQMLTSTGLTVSGGATLQSGLSVTSGETSVQALTANASASFKSGVTVSSGATTVQALRAKEMVIFEQGLSVTGNTSVQALTATGITVNTGDTSVQALTATSITLGNKSLGSELQGLETRLQTIETSARRRRRALLYLPLTNEAQFVDVSSYRREVTAKNMSIDNDLFIGTGSCANFDRAGASLFVDVPCYKAFTVAFWVKPRLNNTPLFSVGGGTLELWLDQQYRPFVNGGVVPTVVLNTDKWNHIAFTYNESEIHTLYVNGESVQSITRKISPNRDQVVVGGNGKSNCYGWISQARIYDAALSAAEIQDLMELNV